MTDIISWSPVDASNNAAPPAGWPENMQPSAVNDCARAMMGAIRRNYDNLLAGTLILPYLSSNGGTVNGSLGVSSSLTVNGLATLSSLHVAGGSNLDGALAASSIISNGNLGVTGNTTLAYLHVTGVADVDGGLRVNSGTLAAAGNLSVSGAAGIGGSLVVSGTGNQAISVPNGGITVAGASSFPYIYGGIGGAGTLQTFGTNNRVCFRWDGANLFSRMDEVLEQRLAYARNFNGFDLGSGGASPTGYDLAAYTSTTPFILHIDIVSDRRLKENVRDTQVDALGAILATPVRAFDWSEAGRRYMPYIDPHAPIGLVAQEVQETMPWVVGVSNFKESDDVPVRDMHRVLHDRLTAYLVRAVQQLSARIDALTTGENHV